MNILDLDTRLRAIGATSSDDCLEVPPSAGSPARQLRVIDGSVFVRDARGEGWQEADWRSATPQHLLGYFVDDSPVATWLRGRGADLIRIALVNLGR